MNNPTQDSQSEVTYGYDPASPDGDYSALTIRHKGIFYNFVGDDADAIEAYVTTRVKEAERLAKVEVYKSIMSIAPTEEKNRHVYDNCAMNLVALTTTTNGKEE